MRNTKVAYIFISKTGVLLAGVAGLTAAVIVGAATLTLAPRSAEALPAYAQQTGLPCGQCHVNPAGGGDLKSLGKKFQANGHKLK
jgi:hypothetical protein